MTQYYRGFTVVWKRQEQYELVVVIIFYVLPPYLKNMYCYV